MNFTTSGVGLNTSYKPLFTHLRDLTDKELMQKYCEARELQSGRDIKAVKDELNRRIREE